MKAGLVFLRSAMQLDQGVFQVSQGYAWKPKCSKPGSALEQWFSVSEKVDKKKLVSIRYDLMPGENNKGGSNNPFYLPKEKVEEDWAIQTLEQSLLRDGYTIWNETSTRRLYVIETYPTKDTPEDKVGCLYVGQTAYPIEERSRTASPWSKISVGGSS